jgi:molybdopterin synthase catalytic subunit
VIRVQQEDFDAGAEIARLTHGNHGIGGVCSFIGLVRDMAGGEKIDSMELEHYPGMTEKELTRIEAEANDRWPLEATLIIHRHGPMKPGDQIVLVVAASAHRKAAFEACEFLIDFLKTKAPFWKKEGAGDVAHWVEAKDEDDRAAEKWVKTQS